MSKDENKKKNDVKNNGRFLKESKAELKKVSWPKPKALANDTFTVIVIVLVVAAIVAVLDIFFLWLNENLIIKTEEKIVNSTTTNETTDLNTILDNYENTANPSESSDEANTVEETNSVETTDNSNAE